MSTEVVTIRDLAAYLNVPARKLYIVAGNREKTGFPAVKVGGRWLARIDQVEEWLVECLERGELPFERLGTPDVGAQRRSKPRLEN